MEKEMAVQRYAPIITYSIPCMKKDADGGYVKFSDIQNLLVEARLLRERAVLMQDVCKWVAQYFGKGVDDKGRIEALHMMSFANFRLVKFDEDQKIK